MLNSTTTAHIEDCLDPKNKNQTSQTANHYKIAPVVIHGVEDVYPDPASLESTQVLSARLIALNKLGRKAKSKFSSNPMLFSPNKNLLMRRAATVSGPTDYSEITKNSLSQKISQMMGSKPLQIKNKFCMGDHQLSAHSSKDRTFLKSCKKNKKIFGLKKPTFQHFRKKELPKIFVPSISGVSKCDKLGQSELNREELMKNSSYISSIQSSQISLKRRINKQFNADLSSDEYLMYFESPSSDKFPSLEVQSVRNLISSHLQDSQSSLEDYLQDSDEEEKIALSRPQGKDLSRSRGNSRQRARNACSITKNLPPKNSNVDSCPSNESRDSMTDSVYLMLERVIDFAEENQLEFVTFNQLKQLFMPGVGKANFGQHVKIRDIQRRLVRLIGTVSSLSEDQETRN